MWTLRFGATVMDEGVQFRVWAPRRKSLAIAIDSPRRAIPMQCEGEGEFAAFVPGLPAGADYALVTDAGAERPDPVSRFQPHGVHGRSRVVDPGSFRWTDQNWKGLALEDYLIYELHTGTFSDEGTFESIIPRLGYLTDVGITAVELMPVAEFPGRRNWGYDGVAPYAPQSSYGGPQQLKRLVDACHRHGLAVVLDVVYNHLGPEGNYLAEFGPYFTETYRTPWGCAINYDGPESDGVRRYFIDNALYWLTEYHVDALRLDAIHGIFDFGARHFLSELAQAFHAQAKELGRSAWVIAESDLNDARVIKAPTEGGYGLDAQWNDDFHHALYSLITGDRHGYFVDFGRMQDLTKSLREGFVYDGQRSAFRRRRHGSSSMDRPGRQFVVFTENHDQIANALGGDRLSRVLSVEQQKIAATVLLCSPFIPLLFMGQEYGETATFHYFTDHGDLALAAAVREGRRLETVDLTSAAEFADPQDIETFRQGKLNWDNRETAQHSAILKFYRDLIAARKRYPCLGNCRKDLTEAECDEQQRWLAVKRDDPSGQRGMILCNFAHSPQAIPIGASRRQNWDLLIWSAAPAYGGPAAGEAPVADIDSRHATLPGDSAALYIEV
ncbi:MAG TPA: malto-oligosyltrehalose trehalohydrolase [Bryobacteraceae bacterium]|nr:malto-oligosyltrehalose trehalohydrolase [Bryobacteraceae bacterium]